MLKKVAQVIDIDISEFEITIKFKLKTSHGLILPWAVQATLDHVDYDLDVTVKQKVILGFPLM